MSAKSGMSLAILIVGFLAIFLYAVSKIEARQNREASQQLLSALHGGSLSTPEAFQLRCGRAHSISANGSAITLDYGTTKVSFDAASVRFLMHGHPIDEERGMENIGCELGR